MSRVFDDPWWLIIPLWSGLTTINLSNSRKYILKPLYWIFGRPFRVIRHVFSDIRFFQNPWKNRAEFNSHHKVLRSIYLNHVWSNLQIFNFSLRFWIMVKKIKKKLYSFVYFLVFRNIFTVYLERKMTFSEITKNASAKISFVQK